MFLATTALTEFWDTSDDKIIFLGEWCKLYSESHQWKHLPHEDAPFLWNNVDRILQGLEECDDIYEKTLSALTQKLNEIHHVNYDTLYYRILLGSWLVYFIQQLYDRFYTLQLFIEKYPKFNTYVLEPKDYYIPITSLDYMQKIQEDNLNLQMYSQILTFLGYEFPAKSPLSRIIPHKDIHIDTRIGYKSQLIKKLSYLIRFIYNNNNQPPVLANIPDIANKIDIFDLLWKTKTMLSIEDFGFQFSIANQYNKKTRKNHKIEIEDKSLFGTCVTSLIFQYLPVIYLEGYQDFQTHIDTITSDIPKPQFVMSSNMLMNNDIFKAWYAKHKDSVQLLYLQHGGGYGIQYIEYQEVYEKSCATLFYNWGWENTEKSKYLPYPKLLTQNRKQTSKQQILFIMTEHPPYTYRIQIHLMSSNTLEKYIDFSIDFLQQVKKEYNVIIRLNPNQFNWNIKERIQDVGISFPFDDYKKSFLKQMQQSHIVVVDHLATTYLESLAINKPTIIIIHPKLYKFREPIYFEKLEKVGILHYSTRKAAEHLNKVYDNVNDWWLQKEVQEVRQEFVHKYARPHKNWLKKWTKELKELSNN